MAPLHAAESDSLAVARKAIADCTPRLDAQADVGYDRIAVRCPDLASALERSGVEQWLPRGWKEIRNNLSAGSLTELRSLIDRELAAHASERKPRVAALNEVLAGLGDQRRVSSDTWLRFKRWLRELLERHDREDHDDWFDRMVDRVGLSDAIGEIVTYISLGAMVVLALIVVLNELKAAGLLGRRARSATEETESDLAVSRPIPTLGEIERAPLLERPRLLLELIAAKLTAIRRLPPAGAMTARELSHAVNLESAPDRERLASLATTAERARYAESGVPEDALASAYVSGRALLDSVETLREPEVPAGATS
ncbi:MAG: DUF4129 domain-containing protein [Gammaproteobacteria bacterium]